MPLFAGSDDGQPLPWPDGCRPRRTNVVLQVVATLALLTMTQGLAGTALAQSQPAAPSWPQGVELRRSLPDTPPAAPSSGWGTSATTAPRPAPPRAAAPPPAPGKVEVAFTAHLTQDGEPIDQGLVWRVFTEPAQAKSGASLQPALVEARREPTPRIALAPGAYYVNVAYGRAHLTRKIEVAPTPGREERFVLNAGGLRVTAVLAGGEKPPDLAVSYDIYEGDADRLGGRSRLVAGLKPGVIVRLNAGLYHLVSTVGDANAVVNADVTVEAGKLTDAVLSHSAARVVLKLVDRAGGEAQADTQWAVHTIQGDLVRESQGALPSHILASGDYIASARHGGRLYQRQFAVKPGASTEIEVVMQ
jgi:hypothetical protein